LYDVIAFRHVRFEDLGILEGLLAERGRRVDYVEAPTASLTDIDPVQPELAIFLGAPISVYQEQFHPFVADELRWLERRLKNGRPVLGICFGAQLVAHALGARVYPSGAKEIGWGPLEIAPAGTGSSLRHLDGGAPVLHWHGDTFDLPDGAVHLASTKVCANQAFSWGKSTLGLQFHCEVLEARLEEWFVGHACELQAAGISVRDLRTESRRWGGMLEQAGARCLGEWLDLVLPARASGDETP
jgi:GMP synthase (glutamine-hydrolysing)